MKTLVRFTLAALLAFAIASPAPAAAVDRSTYAAQTVSIDPAAITSATALTYPRTGTIDTATFNDMSCEVSNNNDGGATRSIIPKCYHDRAGAQLSFTYPTMTVATNAQGRYVFDARISAATADTGVTDSPNRPCRYVKITAAAAAGNGRVSCTLFR